jgi:hypothetical protein
MKIGAREAVGEVIVATTAHFAAQCPRPRLHEPPAFGGFVKIEPAGTRNRAPASSSTAFGIDDPFAEPKRSAANLPTDARDGTLYALVYSASTGSVEPGRHPTAYGLEEERLRAEQPQIFDLLATEFSALHLGFARQGRFQAGIPPQPPRLHALVQECSPEEVCALTDTPDLLRTLLKAPPVVPTDELIVACLRHAFFCRGESFSYLVQMGKQLAVLLREDPDRLTALLDRLNP